MELDFSKHYSRQQARAIEQYLIQTKVTGFELMAKAGDAAGRQILRRYPNIIDVAIFCGVGNNAGDGYLLARHLKQAGKEVTIVQLGNTDKLTKEARSAYAEAEKLEISTIPWSQGISINADLLVDAICGIGLNKDITGSYQAAVKYLNETRAPLVALDIPTGIDADTGEVLGYALQADLTVTFIVYKLGLFLADAPSYCGEVVLETLV